MRMWIAILAALAVGSAQAATVPTGQYVAGILHAMAACSVVATNPAPAPDVTPGICPNCKGVGKVGDGKTMLPCIPCGGTGRITSERFGGLTDGIIDRARDRAVEKAGLTWPEIQSAADEVTALVQWSKAIRKAAPQYGELALAGDCANGQCSRPAPRQSTSCTSGQCSSGQCSAVQESGACSGGSFSAGPARRTVAAIAHARPVRRAVGAIRNAQPLRRAAKAVRVPLRLIRRGCR